MKIWCKRLLNNKIKADMIYSSDLDMSYESYENWVREICLKMDIPAPIVLPTHYKNFYLFHNSRFKKGDFIETTSFDTFMIEDCRED